VPRVCRNGRKEDGFRVLVPEGELRAAGLEEVAEDLVVMLCRAARLDDVPRPA
jgi:hypothetical protein